MDARISKQLADKIHMKRKAAALELEKQVRGCHQAGAQEHICIIIDQLLEMCNNETNPFQIRSGGLLGISAVAIALGIDIAPYMERIMSSMFDCFTDQDNKVRFFSLESFYNVAKVSEGEALVHFNDIFDALSRLVADPDLSVRNGAELVDRLLKDIVVDHGPYYIPSPPAGIKAVKNEQDKERGLLVNVTSDYSDQEPQKAFSLIHFITLLRERISVLDSSTRTYFLSWITVLDSVPELELVAYLPEFLDGLLKYLSDPAEEMRIATENLLVNFLREVRDVTHINRHLDRNGSIHKVEGGLVRNDSVKSQRPIMSDGYDGSAVDTCDSSVEAKESDEDLTRSSPDQGGRRDEATGGVQIDFAAIIKILIQQLDGENNEAQQSIALKWMAEFFIWAHEDMVLFMPQLAPHHILMIQAAAVKPDKEIPTDAIELSPLPADQNRMVLPSVTTAAEQLTPEVTAMVSRPVDTPQLATALRPADTPRLAANARKWLPTLTTSALPVLSYELMQ